MRTLGEMTAKLRIDLLASTTSTNFSDTRLKQEIQDAYTWARGLYFWKALDSARKFSTQNGHDYYDYPSDWKFESMDSLFINGLPEDGYSKLDYKSFIQYRLKHPDNDEQVSLFCEQEKYFFIFPTPLADGNYNGEITGNKQGSPLDLTNADAVTIFTDRYDDGNEAIMDKAWASCKKPFSEKEAIDREASALAKLATIFNKEKNNKPQAQPKARPFIKYVRFF